MLKGKTKVSMDSFLKATEVTGLSHETLTINLSKLDETLQLRGVANCACLLIASIRVIFLKLRKISYKITAGENKNGGQYKKLVNMR